MMTASNSALLQLFPHGSFVRAEYLHGAWGQSTDEERPEGGLTGTVNRFKKNVRAADIPQAYGWIKSIYRDAIEYSGMKRPAEGMIMAGAFLGLLGAGLTFGGGVFLLCLFNADWFGVLASAVMFVMGWVAVSWTIVMPIRRVWHAPRDLPIVFDRKHRKVYRILLDTQPGLKGLYKPWPVRAVAYDWDLLDAEHDVRTVGSAATVTQLHRLVFVVRKSADDPTIIDHFEIGNGMTQGEPMIAPMWEHIRRFMETGGPHLPHPTEPLDSRLDEKPTWWQACGEAGPFGNRYGWWWKNHPVLTAFYHVIVLFSLAFTVDGFFRMHGDLNALGGLLGTWIIVSINWGQGTGIWLQAHTSRLYDWPPEVKDAIGTVTRRGEGW